MDPTKNQSFMQKYLIWPKILYFWLSMAIYSCNSLLGPLMKDSWHLTNSQFGFLSALQGVNFIGAIFWTNMADKTGRHRILLVIATLMSAFFFFVNNLPKIISLYRPFSWNSTITDMIYTCTSLAMCWIFQSALFPLIDSAMLSLLTRLPGFSKDQFGYQRLCGSPAHSLAGIVQGIAKVVVDNKKYDVLVYQVVACTASIIFSVFVFMGVPAYTVTVSKHGHHGGQKDDKNNTAVNVPAHEMKKDERSPVVRLLTNPGFLFYLLFVTSAGLLANTLTIFQPIAVFEAKRAAAKAEEAALIAAGKPVEPKAHNKWDFLQAALFRVPASISEIVVYFSSKHLVATLGVYWLLLFSQFCGIIRILGYAYSPDKVHDIVYYLLEVTKGLNSGLIVSAGVRVASDIALPGTATTAQGLFSGVYKGISISLAGGSGAIILATFNDNLKTLFKFIGFTAVFTTGSFFLKFLLIDRTIGLPGFRRRERAPAMPHTTTISPKPTEKV